MYPEVKVGDLADVTIERPIAEVGPEEIDNTIEMLRRQRTRYDHVDRAAMSADRAIVDFTGRIDGIEFAGGQATDFGIIIGEGRMLPEFEAAVTGMSAGETSRSHLPSRPTITARKSLAARGLRVDRESVAAPEIPEVDVDFAKAFGIASGNTTSSLRNRIELRLELKRKIDAKLREQVRRAARQDRFRVAQIAGRCGDRKHDATAATDLRERD